jgi:ABC-2 type transport system permease protein
MTVFRAVLGWEVRSALRRVSTWVYFWLCFALAFIPMLFLTGAIDLGVLGPTRMLGNSPYVLVHLMSLVGVLVLSVTAAIAGQALHRDYDVGVEQLLYATPLTKAGFLGGRFAGAIVVNLIVLAGIGVGAAIGAAGPWVEADKVAPFDLAAHVEVYVMYVVPNMLLTAAIFFALVALTRQMMPVYVGGVLLLIGHSIASHLLEDLDNKKLAAMLDPFGFRAYELVTQYWSLAEKNEEHLPLTGIILWNRLTWIAVAGALFAVAVWRFRFAYTAEDAKAKPEPGAPALVPAAETFLNRVQLAALPAVTRRSGPRARWAQFASVVRRSFSRIVNNRYFAAIVGAGLLFLAVTAQEAGRLYGTPTWPVTYQVAEVLMSTMGAFVLVVIAVYSGELVWAERDVKSHQIVDATSVPTWIQFLGKLSALWAMIALLLFVMLLAGIVTQAVKGYYTFEIGLYLQTLYGEYFTGLLLLSAAAMTIHVMVNHKYVGHLAVILVLLGVNLILPLLGLERGLYLYGHNPGMIYSDMNGWGPFLAPFVWYRLYWIAFVVMMLVVTDLFWVRGEETSPSWRARLARLRFNRHSRAALTGGGIAFIGLGGFLFFNTDVLNLHRSTKENRHLQAERERKYKRYELAPQPRVMAMSIRVDLSPKGQDFRVAGRYVLRNKTPFPIDTIHLGINEFFVIDSLRFDGGSVHVVADSVLDYHMYRLTKPLAPGDSTVMHFGLSSETRGIPNRVQNTYVVENGSFLSSHVFLPQVGYWDEAELRDEGEREKEKLPRREPMRSPSDPAASRNNYVSSDADWIRFEATVSTDPDQVAIAPGYLQREWTENGRRVFQYVMDAPILNFWAVLSGRYAVKRDTWRDVDISVFHHPEHTYNLDRMVAGVKKALDYYTEQFGPYQHRQVRIVEFPRYTPFAQSLPNLIPYSEGIGFIARIEKKDDIDYPFYVTAHEVAHAWWGHQLIGADAQGTTMLSETLSQYSALMVMEKAYGTRNMRRFLEYELDSYLTGRSTESRRELPLQLVENQPYVHYNKGSLVMYALRDYIGEARVNRVLRRFLDEHKFRGPPYPTSLQLVQALRAETPDSLKYLIEDLFEKVTLYQLRTDSVVLTDAAGQPGKFAVDIWVKASKSRADTVGRETEIAMHDWIDIGVYRNAAKGDTSADKNGVPLYLAKQRVDSGPRHFRIVVDERPIRAGIDPLHKLTDRITLDNVVGVRDRATRPPRASRRDTTRRDSVPRDSVLRDSVRP